MNVLDPLFDSPLCNAADLGRPIPDSPHAVSVCLPTWADNIGYEEKQPRVIERLNNGYPRFVFHHLCQQLFAECHAKFAATDESCLAFPSVIAAERFANFFAKQTGHNPRLCDFGRHGVQAACFPTRFADTAKAGWQHLGEGISSRHAEACLENRSTPDATAAKQILRQRIADAASAAVEDVFLFPSGMNAIFSVYRALEATFPDRKCVQFGFPYVDTLKIQKTCGAGVHFYPRGESVDLDQLAEILSDEPISGIYTEFPSNPLLKSPDLARLAELARTHRCPLVVDDTVSTFVNADVLSAADAVCSSLTKFFSGAGDVTAGSVVLNANGPFYNELKTALGQDDDLLWCEDALVLEQNSRDFEARVRQINRNAEQLADHLLKHPRVTAVNYPKFQTPQRYSEFRKRDGGYGGLMSIELADPANRAPRVFDALRVCKGPNLGTNYTLVCPYTILAHYGELDFAEDCGVSRYLLRVSVGLEPSEDLIARFDNALAVV